MNKKHILTFCILAALPLVLAATDVDRQGAPNPGKIYRQSFSASGGECLTTSNGNECLLVADGQMVTVQCATGATYPCGFIQSKDGEQGGTAELTFTVSTASVADTASGGVNGTPYGMVIEGDLQATSMVFQSSRLDEDVGDRDGWCSNDHFRPCNEDTDCTGAGTCETGTDRTHATRSILFGSCDVSCTITVTP